MKKINIIIAAFLCIGFYKGNAQSIYIGYGGSFAGFGDLQGKCMYIEYHQELSKIINIYGSYNNSAMSGRKFSIFYAGKPFIGLDYVSESILDINDFSNNVKLNNEKLNEIGSSSSYAPPFHIMNVNNVDLGIMISIFNREKFNYYIEGNISMIKLEVIGSSTQNFVFINKDSWVNFPIEREVGLETSFQDHFLDYGFGYGLGIDYKLYEYFTIGANGHYNQYMNDAQNIVTWGIKLGLKL